MTRKSDHTLRIMLHNVNRLPISRSTDKSKKFISTIPNKQIDVALITEVGLYWKLLDGGDQWYERVQESFQATRSKMAYNNTEPTLTATVQFGGVGLIAVDDIAHRVSDQGQDITGLGRWSWLRLKGKQGHHLRIVSAYRPVTGGSGPGTVHAQHERYLGLHDRDKEPRAAFYTDLMQEVATWKALGDHIIIGIDANEDVRLGDTAIAFREMNMQELILREHHDKSPPATCDKNKNREPIDGLFATLGIRIIAGGYSAYNSGCSSDHCYLWIDIPFQDAFGYKTPPMTSPAAR
jgi:hypothetical protein